MATEQQQREKAINSSLIYEDIKERIEEIRQNLHSKWEGTLASDYEGREQTWNMLKALNELERSYLNDIDTGKLLEKEDG